MGPCEGCFGFKVELNPEGPSTRAVGTRNYGTGLRKYMIIRSLDP